MTVKDEFSDPTVDLPITYKKYTGGSSIKIIIP